MKNAFASAKNALSRLEKFTELSGADLMKFSLSVY